MTASIPEAQQTSVVATVNAWLGLGAAIGFLVWVLQASVAPDALTLDAALPSYGWSLATGLVASAVVVLVLRLTFASIGTLGLVSYVSCLFYLAAGKIVGGDAVPWALAGLALVVILVRRNHSVAAEPPLLLLHAMGTVSGLYVFFHLPALVAAVPAFRAGLLALWAWML